MQGEQRARATFVALWGVVCALKFAIAVRLPLFVDEAFYWQEGRHLAFAYSDLPGLTAWLARLGTAIGGENAFALRLPFLLIGALLPWLVMRIARRWFGAIVGWQAASLAVLMPLSGLMGVLAVPDVPLTLATLLCLHAAARLLRAVGPGAAFQLGVGLAIGALSHYRFAGAVGAGALAMLLLPQGRRLLSDPRVLVALLAGALAWVPLLLWNLENAEAGLRFQLVDRHPWQLHADGFLFPLIQALFVTPVLLATLLLAMWRTARVGGEMRVQWRFLGLFAALAAGGIFALGFVTDSERISFHWPLPAWLALLPAAAMLLSGPRQGWRRLVWATSGLGLAAVLVLAGVVATPELRAGLAGSKHYPRNFAGWQPLAEAVDDALAAMPAGTVVVAENFKVGAELGFLRGDPDIAVLDHPLNIAHGRAPQLALWGLQAERVQHLPRLLVLAPGDLPLKHWLQRYHALCDWLGPLPPAQTVSVDHGRQRFLLVPLPPGRAEGACVAPAMAWIDTPVAGARIGRTLDVEGWAFKEGVGLSRIEILLDGQAVADAAYGHTLDVRPAWPGSTDPHHPRTGFRATVQVPAELSSGRHWLSLRLHGADGSVEDWPAQPVTLR